MTSLPSDLPSAGGGPSSSSSVAPPTPPFISRLIVFHLGLLPPPPPAEEPSGEENKQQGDAAGDASAAVAAASSSPAGAGGAGAHDESASVEELAEHVLYYYDAGRKRRRDARLRQQRRRLQNDGGGGANHQSPLYDTGGGGGAGAVSSALDDLESFAMAGSSSVPTNGGAAASSSRRRLSGDSASSGGGAVGAEMRAWEEEERDELGEAARFAGLCAALRTLPSALREATPEPESDSAAAAAAPTRKGRRRRRRRRRRRGGAGGGTREDLAEEVRMESSTLVFVPLEAGECDGLVAVAQVPRSPPSASSSEDNNAAGVGALEKGAVARAAGIDPAAVRAAVARRHRLFALTRGGGVHHRLRTDCDEGGLAALEAEIVASSSGRVKSRDKGQSSRAQDGEGQQPNGKMMRSMSADSVSTMGTMGTIGSAATDEGSRSQGSGSMVAREAREAAKKAALAAAVAEESSGWSKRWKRASIDHRSTLAAVDGTKSFRISKEKPRFQRRASLGHYENYTGDEDAAAQFDQFRRGSGSTAGESGGEPPMNRKTVHDLRESLQQFHSCRSLGARGNSRRRIDEGGGGGGETGTKAAAAAQNGSAGAVTAETATPSLPESAYPGMARLYALRKDLRKLEARLTQRRIDSKLYGADSSSAREKKTRAMERSERKLRRRIARLSGDVLALGRLRSDLKRHYDDLIEEWEEARRDGVALFGTEAQTGVGRCVVELVPAPLSRISGGTSLRGLESKEVSMRSLDCPYNHLPLDPAPHEAMRLGQIARTLLGEVASNRAVSAEAMQAPPPSNIVAVSTFRQGRLMYSHVATRAENDDSNAFEELSLRVDPEAASLLYEYLVSSQSSRRRRRESAKLESTPEGQSSSKGRFLSPPSQSNTRCVPPLLLNERTENSVISLPAPFGDVWAPLVHLPQSHISAKGEDKQGGTVASGRRESKASTRAVLYEYNSGAYCVILYLKDFSRSNTGGVSAASFKASLWSTLISAASRISSSLQSIGAPSGENMQTKSFDNANTDATSVASNLTWSTNGDRALTCREPAVDIVYIDRYDGSLVLLNRYDAPQSTAPAVEQPAPENTETPKIRGGTGSRWFGRKNNQERRSSQGTLTNSSGESDSNKASAVQPTVSARSKSKPSRLDCRHILSSHLPLDVILAFDEMFNEVDRLRGGKHHASTTAWGAECGGSRIDSAAAAAQSSFTCEKVIEMCTFLPQGWAYCRCHGSRELYMLFDTTVYVTLADVQKAAMRVRQGMFNGALL